MLKETEIFSLDIFLIDEILYGEISGIYSLYE